MGKSSTGASFNGFFEAVDPESSGKEGHAPGIRWWRCYSDLPKHKKLWRLPDNNARWAWVVLLCAASEVNGVFETDQHIEALIGTQNAKYLPVFRRVGLMDGLVVHDWDEWQETPLDNGRIERQQMATKAKERYERLGLRDDEDAVVVRSLKDWMEYVIAGPNTQGRLGEFMGAQLGIIPQRSDYGRLAKLMKEFPGGIPALMSAICESALRDLKGDPLSYLTKLASSRRVGQSKPITAGGDRDRYIE